ncbi:DUF1934 domain-containing protein [Clostridium sp.]|uniref:DUF1934 domain-containing protein n=1 Tax=Clostridium sp. TaxID=1506 RepID=UPI0025C08559|nr:DUF1934 domain-containing protein [Clostridium sp.]MBS4957287.1 DUF1934 domain-containing protein [Clostridium sp.]MDU4884789.1 DUF1934 domain-containing protein [Clostridium celatum]MDU7077998.1 DUF1934 domain-containing protein [Clostridium celatum]
MEKRAIISVKSSSNLDPNEAIEVVTPGKFIIEENGFKAIYEESEISGMEGTTTTLNIQDNIMVLERVGSTTTNMEFKEGTMAVSLYNTPYGVLNLNVDTEKLNINVNENGGEIYSKYILGLEGQEGITTELNIKIKVN